MTAKKIVSLFIMMGLLTGCAADFQNIKQAARDQENSAAHGMTPIAYQSTHRAEGSLWSETEGVTFFADSRARQVGDIVIVRIVEDPEAELNANTSTSRTSGVDASKLEVLGFMKNLAAKNKWLGLPADPATEDLMLASLGTKFNGKGSSDRDGHVQAYVSAIVVKVFPNGNLLVNGRREIRVNNETEYITISGIIRVEDISPSNEISSAYVADARIAYSGTGPVGDKQKPGWLMGAIDYVWPF
ncbi:MAG: flagellar basal body L-ring protein FlgH [Desulfobacteraceae bacterium]|nr:MAG: flagellar basal body L-ring protein FlgH [Desulfobacteraceae bacterium]